MSESKGTYTWRVNKFSKLPKATYYSPTFEVGGYLWRLELNPPGFDERGKDFLGIFLHWVDSFITPAEDCLSVSVRFTAVNKKNASDSMQSTVQHTFTCHSRTFGVVTFVPLGNLMDLKAGILVGDTLCVDATIEILKHPLKKAQPLVSFDVGGKTFKMDEETLARYPDSRLPKMVKEFRALVHKGTAIYVDRDPKTFPWIREIYRNGDYDTSLPSSSRKLLQRELDFFQLPSLEKLGIENSHFTNDPKTMSEK